MALKKCKDCKHEISKKAKKCPNCGAPQGPKQYSIGSLILLLIVGGVIYSAATGDRSTSSRAQSNFSQKGYFKDEMNNRVFTVAMKKQVGYQLVWDDARKKPNAPGQITAVYYYESSEGMPIDGVTKAKNYTQADNIIRLNGLSAWRYAYMVNVDGTETKVDCKEEPKSALCKDG